MSKISTLPAKSAEIIRTASKVVDSENIRAFCIYGSQVSGYAKEDSDYDVIVVLDKYRPKIKYKYINGDIDVSALLVDSSSIVSDAEKGTFGEFVAGRFLNPYAALEGEEFLKFVEVSYKTRVITETLGEIVSTYGEFSHHLRIPIEFFLFEKLRKRAAIYPPTLYSYVNSYSGKNMKKNLRFSKLGFLDGASALKSKGLVEIEDDVLRIELSSSKASYLKRLSTMVRTTTRGMRQYATHGYAGRVGWNILRKESLSKLSRMKEIREPTKEIGHPRDLWSIEEGELIVDSEDWFSKLIDHLGLTQMKNVSEKRVAIHHDVAKIYRFSDGSRSVNIAVKKFSELRSVKWVALNIWAIPSTRFRISPIARLAKEYTYLRDLRKKGFNTPRILAIVLGERIMVTEFIEGVSIGEIIAKNLKGESSFLEPVELYGETLGRVHAEGYRLGDAKPSNAIYKDGEIYLIDLEQASFGGDKSWDIAEFLYYSVKLTTKVDIVRKIVASFLKGYLTHGSQEIVNKASDLKYLTLFYPILAPNVTKAVRKSLSGK